MPTYKDITVTIHTPFSLKGLPEIAPADLSRPTANCNPESSINRLIIEERHRISVFIPVLPQSLFWLSYKVNRPPQDGTFFVFKLLVNQEEIVTWCCDINEKWQGKTMFGLFDTGKDAMVVGGEGMEKRVFKFGRPGDEDWRVVGDLSGDGDTNRYVEVRICRANLKMRIPRELETFGSLTTNDVDMTNGSTTKRGHPRAYYKFGLIDPQDAPYATFRFYYRTWEEIDELNLQMENVDLYGSESIISELDSARATPASGEGASNDEDRFSISAEHSHYKTSPAPGSSPKTGLHGSRPLGTPHSSPDRGRLRQTTHLPTAARHAHYQQMRTPVDHSYGPWVPPLPQIPQIPSYSPLPPPHSNSSNNILPYLPQPESIFEPETAAAVNIRRLSIPPTTILRPLMQHGPLETSPTKSVDDQARSKSRSAIPAPVEQTPARKRAETGGILMSVMANALRRRMTDTGR
ncbi:hypothetical protein EJ08DRAFT_677104 [Tothia fuscella]|uniref:Uncharacterized protein n=1 Tax=Tothia fuscella TaxID=1048955 RepID=A0A9P4NY03_9PEZI|nr:hypothetical protein EJ08DRAFT_677104 [Tothia fuscella]